MDLGVRRLLSAKERSLLEQMEPRAAADGVEIVTLEIVGAKKSPVIRVYIDTEDGVSFDTLSSTQAWMGKLLDEIDPFPGAYMLEVSSPGIDRPLRTLEHFRRFTGKKANIRTTKPLDGRSNFKGVIASVSDDAVSVDVDGLVVDIPFDTIKRANLIGEVNF